MTNENGTLSGRLDAIGVIDAGRTAALRSRYLDLVMRILVNAIYQDPAMDPWSGRAYDEKMRAVGRDWPSTAHTMVGLARLSNLRELVEKTLLENIPGDYIETGVWRGGCCILMKAVLTAYGERRKLYVADSFVGLPPPKGERFPGDAGDLHHTYDVLAVPLEEVSANFRKYDLLDEDVVFVKGFFESTLPALQAGPFALLRLDGDMYESTIIPLEHLYPKLSSGGFVLIDDYGAVPGCRQAVDDYRRENNIGAPIHEVDWTGVWWRKP